MQNTKTFVAKRTMKKQVGAKHKNFCKIKSNADMVQNTNTFVANKKTKQTWCKTPIPLK